MRFSAGLVKGFRDPSRICALAHHHPKACPRGPLFWGTHRLAYSTKTRQLDVAGKVLAIRREDQSVWERRAPLAPEHVRKLVKNGVKVLVQPSNRRAYPMQAYANAGARIQEDITEASVIIGVKQVPIDALIPNKTYCFFSHTIKAQEANMPLLDALLEKNIRLIDYERMVNDEGQRVVAFGIYAGVAGMINILHGLGLRLLALGHHTPFMHIGPAHNYRTTEMAKAAVRDAGYEISLGNMPKSLGVMTFIFTGSGNVSQGAQEVFRELPIEMVSPEILPKVCSQGQPNKLYGCEVSRPDHYKRKNGGRFDAAEFAEHPERYYSSFSKSIAPYTSVLINGIYWAVESPRLLTIPDAKQLSEPVVAPWLAASPGAPTLPHRLVAICDISADPGGSIEFMTDCTTIDNPFCIYDPSHHTTHFDSFKGPGFLVCSIDNMPTQLPREATDFFGELLLPHMYSILQSDARKSMNDTHFSPEVTSAVITSNGELTPGYQYITSLRQNIALKSRQKVSGVSMAEPRHKVLLLGAGYVSGPVVEYLTRDRGVKVTVASTLKDEADSLANRYPNTVPILLDVQEASESLNAVVKEHDIVVSVLPYHLHPVVAECCIEHRRNMVTASYCSPAMQELHNKAVDAGITIVNEVGLDPGIDHLLAMEYIDYVHMNGGKIESFVSYCGGLPAPEHSENPLRYKFSWSPRGVLLNALSGAKYVLDGKVIDVPPGSLMSHAEPVGFLPGFALEGYPNRDSLIYKDLYGISEAKTVLRGSLRYSGYSETMNALVKLGMIDSKSHPTFHSQGPELSWRKFVCAQMGKSEDTFFENVKRDLENVVGSATAVDALEQLGLLSDDPVVKFDTPLDTLSNYLSKRLRLGPQERDIVILRHDIGVRWPDGRYEKKGINLVCYGDVGEKGYSAMAKTVGYPSAIATKMVLNGEIQGKGNVLPFTPDIYRPMLTRLNQEGIWPYDSSEQDIIQ